MSIALIWFRQDLRLNDNLAFINACNHYNTVIPIYILDKVTTPLGDAQQWWLHHSLEALSAALEKKGLTLVLRQGNPLDIIQQLTCQVTIDAIYWNRCYEPLAIQRDTAIKTTMQKKGIQVYSSKGNLLNEPWNIRNKSGSYFKVFTPYWKHCLQTLIIPKIDKLTNNPKGYNLYSESLSSLNLLPNNSNWALKFSKYWQPGEKGAQIKLTDFINYHLNNYKTCRDIPAEDSTSKLSPHLHFGEISVGEIWRAVELAKLDQKCYLRSAEHFQSEIGWREFSYYLLYHFPTLPHDNFKSEFNNFAWQSDHDAFKCWQTGTTGYPMVDAGMRELWATGYMHNRVRMIVASFLTKHLLIDWREGAAWFMNTLVDADLANNSASWQWISGCGADAAPYFRIFNPVLQSEKFDPHGNYIRQWIPELANVDKKHIHQPWAVSSAKTGILIGKHYPAPIVDHNQARKRALQCYQNLKNYNFKEKQ